ncbi:DUF3516 domain-containing protein [Corynebacterium tapiri]|uniref:DUF3516 domain-containing protein n=1 Tax=Corynebacterium tapiri TaxID=1448266 RepID=A0A5C4U6U2_9CORY|nr:DEAD/DEAH box helicase [Corynebacterium tapiri]TNL99211.1 DUF3516 domain-containing protein [Corynebacterium tapiri]
MNLAECITDLADVPEAHLDDVTFDTFTSWVASRGISLYPAQEEASLAVLAGDNVILATPTGSGKSMVANASHFFSLARGKRSFYTAPIKALVSEKFFALCDIFGPENVGMMTGDATVNYNAPIIAATAEIVANMALRQGAEAPIDQVVMDEFHYYSDPERGWAWQVPLLELPQTQFVLMSATLGDTTALKKDLTERTGRKTTEVTGSTRPVPLDFHYVYTPVHETIDNLMAEGKAPIYVVHFSQREATERAQALTSLKLISAEEKEAIAKELAGFRFTSTYGKTLSSLLRKGIGVHHAGMLPKYRRLVERLAQTGLLKVICGTDTLGVGINVPIRTVLMTGLAKFDGTRQRTLKSREFHQIAGRAGRAGYDTEGTVIIQAPEHEIENAKARERAGSDPKKLKKIRKRSAREGEVTWSQRTFDRLTEAEPEQLSSQFKVSNSMLINLLERHGNAYEHAKHLLRTNHDPRPKQNQDILTMVALMRGLLDAGLATRREEPDRYGRTYHLTRELPRDFALNQPLSPFALAALDLLDPESDTYELDLISVFESILDSPRQILKAQEKQARGDEIAHLKAEGVEYTERMALIEEVTYPQPLAELLDQAYDTFAETQPWVKEFELEPKSIVREMIEKAMTFSDLVSTYQLARSEGVVLRYLTDAWRTLKHTVPEEYVTERLADIIEWLGELVRQVDSSLVDEWARMGDEDTPVSAEVVERELAFGVEDPTALTANRRAFTVMVRNYFFRLVDLFALEREEELAAMTDYLDDAPDFPSALDDYFDEYDDVDITQAARGSEYFHVTDNGRLWTVRQIIKDPEGDNSFAFEGVVDLDASDEAGEVRLSELTLSEQ